MVWGEERFPEPPRHAAGHSRPRRVDSLGALPGVLGPRADGAASGWASSGPRPAPPRPANRDPPGARQRPETARVQRRAGSQSPPLPSLPAPLSQQDAAARRAGSGLSRARRGDSVPAPPACTPELSPSSETDELSVSSSSELLPSFSA